MTKMSPVLPFLVFLEFLVFSPCEEFLVFLSVFPFFSRDFRGSVGIKNPCFFWWFSLPFSKKNKERKDRVPPWAQWSSFGRANSPCPAAKGVRQEEFGKKATKKGTEASEKVTPAKQTKERSVHELFAGAFRNKSSICESCLFSQGKPPEFTKMGEIHELFVLALSLVWFAGATPEKHQKK